jgi:molybdate transport repressor ModE-like protein
MVEAHRLCGVSATTRSSDRLMLYDTVLLRTFVAICDSGSFTKAAREVNLTQSAVSLHVKRLEDQVGTRLIVRNARGIRLTEQGEVLLSYARRILALYKEAEHRLSRDSVGLIRISAPQYFDLHTLSSLLGQFSACYPAVRLQIELGIGPDISALLDEGELDLAIVSNEIREGDGVSLCRERRVWAAGRAMQLDPEEPAPLALYPPFCRWRQLALEELDRAGRAWTLVIQSAGTAGILAALEAGLAITVFPEFNLPSSLKSLGPAEALPALPDFEFVLRRSRNSSLAADHLAEMIVNFFQLSTALRPGTGMNYKQRSHLLLRTRQEA